MPVITIAGNDGISVEKKREMVKKVSEVVAEAYDLPVDAITVLVQAYPKESIGVAGELLSDRWLLNLTYFFKKLKDFLFSQRLLFLYFFNIL